MVSPHAPGERSAETELCRLEVHPALEFGSLFRSRHGETSLGVPMNGNIQQGMPRHQKVELMKGTAGLETDRASGMGPRGGLPRALFVEHRLIWVVVTARGCL